MKKDLKKVFSNKHDEYLLGGSILEGTLSKGTTLRIVRQGAASGDGKVLSLQKNKQTVDKVEHEGEFGMQITLDTEPHQGDTIECYSTSMQ